MRGSTWAIMLGLPLVAMVIVAQVVLVVTWKLAVALSSAGSKRRR